MIVNEAVINYIFDKKNIAKNILALFLMLIGVTIIMGIIISTMYNNIYSNNEKLLKTVYIPKDYDFENMLLAKCKTINCKEIIHYTEDGCIDRYRIIKNNMKADGLYNIEHLEIDSYILTDYLTINLDLVIKDADGVMYILNNSEYINLFLYLMIITYVLVTIFFLVSLFYNSKYNYTNNLYERGSYKLYTESKIQGNISEMLHHEISAPISILESCATEYTNLIESIKLTDSQKSEYEYIRNGMTFSLDRLNSILMNLYQTRDIKKEYGTSMYVALKHIINTVNRLQIGKLTDVFVCGSDHTLEKIAVNPTLGNGNFLNIMNIILTNSIEAGSTTIEYKVEVINSKFIYLYIKDNGRGIRDKNNDILPLSQVNIIMDYGYSTKDKKGNHIVKINRWKKFLSYFGLRVISTETNRGIGLYMVKMLLLKAGGNLKVVETKETGTTFKLKIPIIKSADYY